MESGLETDSLDPRIKIELDELNKACDNINRLETEIGSVRGNYKKVFTSSSQQLNELSTGIGSAVEKARPYYEARLKAKEAHAKVQQAALRFERACAHLTAAKETVTLAEEAFFDHGQPFESAWQEMLNHATTKVNDAEKERLESELEHESVTTTFDAAQVEVKRLYKDLKKYILKSKPYFELKARSSQVMQEQKSRLQNLEKSLQSSKSRYAESLRRLERISDDIRDRRQGEPSGDDRAPEASAEAPRKPTAATSDSCDSRDVGQVVQAAGKSYDSGDSRPVQQLQTDNSRTDAMTRRKGFKSKQSPHQRRSYEEAISKGASNELLLRTDLLRQPIRRYLTKINTSSLTSLQHPSYTPLRAPSTRTSTSSVATSVTGRSNSDATAVTGRTSSDLQSSDGGHVAPSQAQVLNADVKTPNEHSGECTKAESTVSNSVLNLFSNLRGKLSLNSLVSKTGVDSRNNEAGPSSSDAVLANSSKHACPSNRETSTPGLENQSESIQLTRKLLSKNSNEVSYAVEETVVEGKPVQSEGEIKPVQIVHGDKRLASDAPCDDNKRLASDASCEDDKRLASDAPCDDDKRLASDAPCDDDKRLASDAPCADHKRLASDAPCDDDKRLASDAPYDDKRLASDAPCDDHKRLASDAPCDDDKRLASDAPCDDDKRLASDEPCDDDKRLASDALCDDDKRLASDAPCDDDKRLASDAPCDDDKRLASDAPCDDDKRLASDAPCDDDKRLASDAPSDYVSSEVVMLPSHFIVSDDVAANIQDAAHVQDVTAHMHDTTVPAPNITALVQNATAPVQDPTTPEQVIPSRTPTQELSSVECMHVSLDVAISQANVPKEASAACRSKDDVAVENKKAREIDMTSQQSTSSSNEGSMPQQLDATSADYTTSQLHDVTSQLHELQLDDTSPLNDSQLGDTSQLDDSQLDDTSPLNDSGILDDELVACALTSEFDDGVMNAITPDTADVTAEHEDISAEHRKFVPQFLQYLKEQQQPSGAAYAEACGQTSGTAYAEARGQTSGTAYAEACGQTPGDN